MPRKQRFKPSRKPSTSSPAKPTSEPAEPRPEVRRDDLDLERDESAHNSGFATGSSIEDDGSQESR